MKNQFLNALLSDLTENDTSFRSISDAVTVSFLIDVAKRKISSQWLRIHFWFRTPPIKPLGAG